MLLQKKLRERISVVFDSTTRERMSIVFNGITHLGASLAIVLCYVDDGWLVCLQIVILVKSLQESSSVLLVQYSIVAAMKDHESVNE